MAMEITPSTLFVDYYRTWVDAYKKGAVRDVTLKKYALTCAWLEKLAPEMPIGELNRTTYQQILNQYAETHERQTTMDFHHQLKGALLDAVDEGLIERDPTRKVVIKGGGPDIFPDSPRRLGLGSCDTRWGSSSPATS